MTRRGRRRVEADAGISVTSMMDMFTILLIYLLYFFDPTDDSSKGLQLATSDAKDEQPAALQLTVAMEGVSFNQKDLVAFENGHFHTEEELTPIYEALKQAHDTAASDTDPLVVRCDKRVVYDVLEAVLGEASRAGYRDFRFVVMSGNN